jgi:putative sterol carrier protein
MAVFQNSKQFYDTIGELMERAKTDPVVGPKIAKAGVVIQFRYTDPEAVTTINAKAKPMQAGAFVDVFNGPTNLKPDIEMTMPADLAHQFWQGKLNLVEALMKKKIILKGNQMKVLGLLPAVEPLYKKYPELLKEKGLEKLISK